MKKITTSLLVALCVLANVAIAQSNLGVGTATPNSSAKLDVSSTTQGMLIPRMTKAQRDAIATPATSLMIYQTDNTPGFYYNSGTPAAPVWSAVGAATSSSASFELYVTITATEAQTTAIGNSGSLPFPTTFSPTNSTNAALTGGNTWTRDATLASIPASGNSTFTVGATGAGLYLINVGITNTITHGAIMIDVNGTGNSGTSLYGASPASNSSGAALQSPHHFRSDLIKLLWLNAGDKLVVRVASLSTTIGLPLNTDGTSYLSIAKLK